MTTFEERHGRPKPPGIRAGMTRIKYEEEHQIGSVFKHVAAGQWVYAPPGDHTKAAFNTHAEAIDYAQQPTRDAITSTFQERHGRPKPPRANDVEAHEMYRMRLRAEGFAPNTLPLRVYRIGGPIAPDEYQYIWHVVNRNGYPLHIADTHAEAITNAQRMARKDYQ